ncbi:MAG TPA: YdcF family protein [Allocoleopsis sp.]
MPKPQAILVLEGESDRVLFAAQFWRSHRNLPVWVSGNPEGQDFNRQVFQQAGVPFHQVHYDFCATDTVTNLTCTVDEFAANGIQHVYLITSKYHMRRSVAIASLVFGSRGIVVTPIAVASNGKPEESLPHVARDCVRSIIWLTTGWTGASLNPRLHH